MNLRQLWLCCLMWPKAATAFAVVSAVGVGGLLQAGAFRGALVHVLERRTGRAIEVQEDLRISVFSLHPSIAARHLRADEQLDLLVRGSPRHLRLLRIKAPLAVKGTLSHPTVSILGGCATLAIVDPGRERLTPTLCAARPALPPPAGDRGGGHAAGPGAK